MRWRAIVESAVRSELMRYNPCSLDVLLARLPQFSWSEVFAVVDELSRTGEVVLRHPERFSCEVSLGPIQSAAPQADRERAVEGVMGVGAADQGSYAERKGSLV